MRICPKCKDGYMVKSHVSGGWDCENCKYHEGRQNEMFASAYRGLRNTQRGADKQVDYYEQRLRSKSLQNINDMNTLKQLMKDPVLVQGKSYLNWCHYPLDT